MTHEGEAEAVGHQGDRRIVALLRAKHPALLRARQPALLRAGYRPDDDDFALMRKVVGDIHRHGAQRPDGDVTGTRWRHSLMN